MAAYQHLAKSQGQEAQSAVAAVAARCRHLLAAMTPLPDDLKALAADPWTEQDDRWYFVALAQHYGLVRAARTSVGWKCIVGMGSGINDHDNYITIPIMVAKGTQ